MFTEFNPGRRIVPAPDMVRSTIDGADESLDFANVKLAPHQALGLKDMVAPSLANGALGTIEMVDAPVYGRLEPVIWFQPKLNALAWSATIIQQQLTGYATCLSQLFQDDACFLRPSDLDAFWERRFEQLSSHADDLGLANHRIARAHQVASQDVIHACELIAIEIRKILYLRIADLRGCLCAVRSLKARILRLLARVYRLHNQIILQRRYYLAHGSHPNENTTVICGRLRLDLGGCTATARP